MGFSSAAKAKAVKTSANANNLEPGLQLKMLLHPNNYKRVVVVDEPLPDTTGIYAIRIKNTAALPAPFDHYAKERGHNLIYIGIASQSLNKRLMQELRAKGHGTFFRSLGAVLGYTPPKGSLVGKRNQNNYKFSLSDQNAIIAWINEHLLINWIATEPEMLSIEKNLIQGQKPLLNLQGNPLAIAELTALRNRCKQIGREA
jgi:hypothetical protein